MVIGRRFGIPARGQPRRDIQSWVSVGLPHDDDDRRSGRPEARLVSLALLLLMMIAGCSSSPQAVGKDSALPSDSSSEPQPAGFLFHREVNEQTDLYFFDEDTGESRKIVDGFLPSWSPDGRRFAFLRPEPSPSDPDYPLCNLYVGDLSGETTLIAEAKTCSDTSIAWSPTGNEIAFEGPEPGGGENAALLGGLQVVAADGTGMRLVSRIDTYIEDSYLHWSPDGTKLALVATGFAPELQDIYIVDTERTLNPLDPGDPDNYLEVVRSELETLINLTMTGDDLFEAWPTWSPESDRIAFVRPDAFGNSPDELGLFVVTSEGNSVNEIGPTGLDMAWTSWSPEGSQIAFVASRDPTSGSGNYYNDLYVVNSDGTNLMKLASFQPSAEELAAESDSGIWQPVWDDSGQSIYFSATAASEVNVLDDPSLEPDDLNRLSTVYKLTLDGTDPVPLVKGFGIALRPNAQ